LKFAAARFTRSWVKTAPEKSTLMKLLAGVHEPDDGEIQIDGQVRANLAGHGSRGSVSFFRN
jgi:ABC-type multidrug transport system fused ATPase/permease subunit